MEAVALLFPVAVVVECDLAVSFSVLRLDDDGRDFAKAFEDLARLRICISLPVCVRVKI